MRFKSSRKLPLLLLSGPLACLLLTPGCPAADAGKTASASPHAELPAPLRSLAANMPAALELYSSWTGVGGTTPSHTYQLSYLPARQKYQLIETIKGQKPLPARFMPIAPIKAALAAVPKAIWQTTEEPVSVMTHTDDYPVWRISLKIAPNHTLELSSLSSTENAVPWNLRFDKQLYYSSSPELGAAAFGLFKQLPPAK